MSRNSTLCHWSCCAKAGKDERFRIFGAERLTIALSERLSGGGPGVEEVARFDENGPAQVYDHCIDCSPRDRRFYRQRAWFELTVLYWRQWIVTRNSPANMTMTTRVVVARTQFLWDWNKSHNHVDNACSIDVSESQAGVLRCALAQLKGRPGPLVHIEEMLNFTGTAKEANQTAEKHVTTSSIRTGLSRNHPIEIFSSLSSPWVLNVLPC